MILDRILAETRAEVARRKLTAPMSTLEQKAKSAPGPRGLAQALGAGGTVRLLAEVKHKSPSKGVLRSDFDPVSLARAYEKAGADAISVLTDEPFFGGSLLHLRAVRETVPLPVLRKDFIVDPYQIVEARAVGADAVLLIAAALDDKTLGHLLAMTRDWGMDALVEVHTENELERALAAGADFVGINNRDLNTFETSLDVTLRLAPRVPAHVTLVSESGIRSRGDVTKLAAGGVHAVLVGERLVTDDDPTAAARALVGVALPPQGRMEAVAP